jgi:hypothetical protein
MVTGIHLHDKSNAGDIWSSPLHYFDFGVEVRFSNIYETADPEGDIIIGGGGLLGNEAFDEAIERIASRRNGKLIFWGVGHNGHRYPFQYVIDYRGFKKAKAVLRSYLNRYGIRRHTFRPLEADYTQLNDTLALCDLRGVRDYGTGFDWVPCASCMHPLLDKYREAAPKREVVVFEHPLFMSLRIEDYPVMRNLDHDLAEIMSFLSSAETIITSSYHGAYWGILLNRKVVCVPWSTKFMRFKHEVRICQDLLDLKSHLKAARSHPSALEECRRANCEYAEKVGDVLGVSVTPKEFSGHIREWFSDSVFLAG